MRDPCEDPLTGAIARRGIVIVDGGLATSLAVHGADLSGGLWSARALRESPDLVRQVHLDFLRAGADVVVTASYQASFAGFARVGVGDDEATRMLRRSVALAREATVIASRPDAFVAASVGPFGASLADGSEYRGDYDATLEDLRQFHRRRLEVLTDAEPDLLAIETVPSALELHALLELLDEMDGPAAWVTFACRDEAHIADGTPFARVAADAAALRRVVGVGINCTPPQLVAPLLGTLRPLPVGTHLVVYPNIGDTWDPDRGCWVADEHVDDVETWIRQGVDVVGGCCGTSPEHIRRLVEARRDLVEHRRRP